MGWYVLMVAPRRTMEIVQQVRDKCFLYCPVVESYVRRPNLRKRQLIEEPAYPGYIFLEEFSIDAFFDEVSRDDARLMKSTDRNSFYLIVDAEIKRIMKAELDWNAATRSGVAAADNFSVGDRVTISSGLWEGREGTIKAMRGAVCSVEVPGFLGVFKINAFLLSKKEGEAKLIVG